MHSHMERYIHTSSPYYNVKFLLQETNRKLLPGELSHRVYGTLFEQINHSRTMDSESIQLANYCCSLSALFRDIYFIDTPELVTMQVELYVSVIPSNIVIVHEIRRQDTQSDQSLTSPSIEIGSLYKQVGNLIINYYNIPGCLRLHCA